MKSNEAPKKIYLFENPIEGTPDYRWLSERSCDEDIEYTRTDALIEKACKWLKENGRDYATYDDSKIMPNMRSDVNIKRLIRDFRKAMKE